MNTTVYKVLAVDGQRHSVASAKGWDVVYERNKWATGIRGTPLFSFGNLKNARGYCLWEDLDFKVEIWKAEGKNVRPSDKLIRLWSPDWPKFWSAELPGDTAPFPGTLWADKVRLLEKVWPQRQVRRKA